MSLFPSTSFANVDSFFDDVFPAFRGGSSQQSGLLMPKVDIEESADKFLIKAEMPGIKKEDLSVELEGDILTIKAEHKEEKEEKKEGKVIRRERRTGSYLRSFNVGQGVSEKDITGEFVDGVLRLTVPKSGKSEPETRRIAIQ
jgi:HSP20 family protein